MERRVIVFSILTLLLIPAPVAQCQPGVPWESFADPGAWTLLSGTALSGDSIHVREGMRSIRLTAVDQEIASMETDIVGHDVRDDSVFAFWAYVDTTDVPFMGLHDYAFTETDPPLSYLRFRMTSTRDWSRYFYTDWSGETELPSDWNRLVIGRSRMTSHNGESWDNPMIKVGFEIKSRHFGDSARVSFDGFTYNRAARAKVILCFYDSHRSAFDLAFPILAANGQKAVAFVVCDRIDSSDAFLSSAQLESLYDAGWDIGNHSWSHPRNGIGRLDSLEQYEEIDACYRFLRDDVNVGVNGPRYFAYPWHSYRPTTLSIVRNHETIMCICGRDDNRHDHVTTHSGIRRFTLPCRDIDYPLLSSGAVRGWIMETIATNGVLILNLHNIYAANPNPTITPRPVLTSDVQEVSDLLDSLSDHIDVVTVSEYLGLTGVSGACACPRQGDVAPIMTGGDGIVNSLDVTATIDFLFRGGAPLPSDEPVCPRPRADVAPRAGLCADGTVNLLDVVELIEYVFRGGVGICDPCGF